MVDLEIPSHFVYAYRSASATDLADLSTAGQALKAKGLCAEQIAQRIAEAGWDKDFSTWYAQMLLGREGELRLVVPAVVDYPRGSVSPDEAKLLATGQVGKVLAIVASVWLMVWPWLGIRGLEESLVSAVVGLALFWEGFARMALSKGLSRIHGACAMTSLIVQILLFVVLASLEGGRVRSGPPDEEQQLYAMMMVVLATILPVGLSWLMFRLTTSQALARKAKTVNS